MEWGRGLRDGEKEDWQPAEEVFPRRLQQDVGRRFPSNGGCDTRKAGGAAAPATEIEPGREREERRRRLPPSGPTFFPSRRSAFAARDQSARAAEQLSKVGRRGLVGAALLGKEQQELAVGIFRLRARFLAPIKSWSRRLPRS